MVYANAFHPVRVTQEKHLFCFKKYGGADFFYFNVDTGQIPLYLLKVDFDLIIFQTLFISCRWMGTETFNGRHLGNIESLKNNSAVKILLPQDEWYLTDVISDFIRAFGINIVFTLAPDTELKKIYTELDFEKVKFFRVLTGYLDDDLLELISNLQRGITERTIDIGYRSNKSPPWLGRDGYYKTEIALMFNNATAGSELKTSISTELRDTIFGNKWFEFLLRCKYTIGVEGGATVIDRDGKINIAGRKFFEENPDATFHEIEEECFRGLDGNISYLAISPRHLEACATRTCQVLLEGSYNGILKPGVHYIELKKDYSNLHDVLEHIRRDDLREKITENAYRDVVASGNYDYSSFVRFVLEKSLPVTMPSVSLRKRLYTFVSYYLCKMIDAYNYHKITKESSWLTGPVKFLRMFGFGRLKKMLNPN